MEKKISTEMLAAVSGANLRSEAAHVGKKVFEGAGELLEKRAGVIEKVRKGVVESGKRSVSTPGSVFGHGRKAPSIGNPAPASLNPGAVMNRIRNRLQDVIRTGK